jgi:hypothetical protein
VYPLHDSVVISLSKREIDLIPQIKNVLEGSVHKVKQYIGKDFLELNEIKI